jgi:hypothetical protein
MRKNGKPIISSVCSICPKKINKREKIILHNKITEEVKIYNCIGCRIGCEGDNNVHTKLDAFQYYVEL